MCVCVYVSGEGVKGVRGILCSSTIIPVKLFNNPRGKKSSLQVEPSLKQLQIEKKKFVKMD